MAYGPKIIDHFENPRNIGSLDKNDPAVGTGVVGAPECGDVMKLQIKIAIRHQCIDCQQVWTAATQQAFCPQCQSHKINTENVIDDARFKTFGCGSAIASSSFATEWLKGKTLEEALQIRNTMIVEELSLPPVKIHCSVLAEDAVRAALADWRKKRGC